MIPSSMTVKRTLSLVRPLGAFVLSIPRLSMCLAAACTAGSPTIRKTALRLETVRRVYSKLRRAMIFGSTIYVRK